ncbi:MAG: peptidoglycan DD-metalloendopeptidase family protein [Lachnospiraceae bacterium]|nr:peptidoglycan DD-metalloendopeptidase family protein [Lachnospiraceae bacterium]
MKNRKCVMRVIAFLAVIALTAEMPLFVRGEKLTNDLIKQSEAEKKNAETSKAQLRKGLTDVKQMIADLESAKGELKDYIVKLDEDLALIEENIEILEAQIEEKKKEIEATKLQLSDAIWDSQQQYGLMRKRIQFVYENGKSSNIDLILNSSSFVDFLNRAEYVARMSEYDKKMLDKYMETQEAIERIKEKLEAEEAELNETMETLETEKSSLEELINAKENQISVYEADINNKEAAVKEYEAEIAAQEEIIKVLEERIEQERKRLEAENRKARSYDGGMFKWPCPNYTRISDDYGMRIHPTLGIEKFHNGIDLAAPTGSDILAAYDGDVVGSGYSSTMGNYIMLDHGDGLITIYMHASKLYVSTGQSVNKGQCIAAVGSTGRSTGPHLHFGVRLNGSYVSPWKYLK